MLYLDWWKQEEKKRKVKDKMRILNFIIYLRKDTKDE